MLTSLKPFSNQLILYPNVRKLHHYDILGVALDSYWSGSLAVYQRDGIDLIIIYCNMWCTPGISIGTSTFYYLHK